MAYVNFAEIQRDAYAGLIAAQSQHDGAATGFSALEWSVVALARKDRLASLDAPGRIAVALGVLFGDRPNPRLADPRLEALRRAAVLAWHHGYTIPSSELRRFIAAGFTLEQYETLQDSIGAARAAHNYRGHA